MGLLGFEGRKPQVAELSFNLTRGSVAMKIREIDKSMPIQYSGYLM